MIDKVQELFRSQIPGWPLLAKGIEALSQANTRRELIDGCDIYVRHIPHRVASTTAATDRESLAKRPCFLCRKNLPVEEEGLQFGDDFTIYCNPYPIVEHHLTIAHNQHVPQTISDQFETMLDLALALPRYFVIYNGPECGASAPDHLHFQAGSRKLFPIAKDSVDGSRIAVHSCERNLFVFRGEHRDAVCDQLQRAVQLLAEITGKPAEPLINVAVYCENAEWVVFLFPRAKHRPSVFYTREFTVSPATIDLCGVFVVPLAQDFQSITGKAIAAIFREITLSDALFGEVAAGLESAH